MSQYTHQDHASSSRPSASVALQRRCACGQHGGGECAHCRQQHMHTLQRQAVSAQQPATAPPIVQDVLQSAGQPLDATTRAALEPRFGHDFSRVRVHTDARAAASAQAVDALAYTVGRDVVFGSGQYQPATPPGQRLLAHELTHVVQQQGQTVPAELRIGAADDPLESAADRAADAVLGGAAAPDSDRSTATIQRQDGSDVGTIYLRLREDGRVEVLYGTPSLPVVGEGVAGFRCERGRCSPVFGRGAADLGQTYTLEEATSLLRGLGGSNRAPGSLPGLGQRPGLPGIGQPRLPTPALPGARPGAGSGSGFQLPSAEQTQLRLSPQAARLVGALTLDGFVTNSAALSSDHQQQLTTHAATLRSLLENYPGGMVEIIGHTDAVGTEAANLTLGQQRADAVRDALVAAGISPSSLSATSAGEQRLLVSTQQPEAGNRAVEIRFRSEPRVRLLQGPGLRLNQ